jgi:hypothetical protein
VPNTGWSLSESNWLNGWYNLCWLSWCFMAADNVRWLLTFSQFTADETHRDYCLVSHSDHFKISSLGCKKFRFLRVSLRIFILSQFSLLVLLVCHRTELNCFLFTPNDVSIYHKNHKSFQILIFIFEWVFWFWFVKVWLNSRSLNFRYSFLIRRNEKLNFT